MAKSRRVGRGAKRVLGPDRVPVQHGRLRRSHAIANVMKAAAVIVVFALVGVVSFAVAAVWNLSSSIKPGVALIGHATVPPAPLIGALPGAFSVLLVGSDSAEGDPLYGPRGENLNDVTMLLHVSADHSRATVVSIPRDLFVSIPACPQPGGGTSEPETQAKFNTSLSIGGLACTVLTVEKLTGLQIPYAALIQFQGLIAMSDAVGGVSVCVAKEVIDTHQPFPFVLSPGEHVLKGADALAFLRTRYGLQTGSDLARSSNQRVFLSSLFRKVRSNGTLGNPVEMYKLAQTALDNMTFSTSLGNIQTMVAMAFALKDITPEHMLLLQYPTFEVPGGLEPNTEDAKVLFNAIRGDKPIAVSGGTGAGAAPAKTTAPSAQGSSAPTSEPSTPPSTPPSATAPSATSATPTPSASAENPTVLPSSIEGQSAAEQTCSVGRPLADQ